jgi:hypothetical protein
MGTAETSTIGATTRALAAELDRHVAQLREHPVYSRVEWRAYDNALGVFATLHVTAPVGMLTRQDREALNRLQQIVADRHPEWSCRGRFWSTDRDQMAVTWRYE